MPLPDEKEWISKDAMIAALLDAGLPGVAVLVGQDIIFCSGPEWIGKASDGTEVSFGMPTIEELPQVIEYFDNHRDEDSW